MDNHDQQHAIDKETVYASSPEIPMAMPEGKTAWNFFMDSLTDQERTDELADWDRERVAECVQANAEMIRGFFSTLEHASSKAIISLAFRLRELGLGHLDYSASFKGSRFGVERENFSGSIELKPSTEPLKPASPPRETRLYEAGSEAYEEPEPKMNPVWSDKSGCLALWDQLRLATGDSKGSSSAQDAALLLVHFDFVSHKNAESYQSDMGGLQSTDENGAVIALGVDASCSTIRKETRLAPSPSTRTKM